MIALRGLDPSRSSIFTPDDCRQSTTDFISGVQSAKATGYDSVQCIVGNTSAPDPDLYSVAVARAEPNHGPARFEG